MTTFSEVLADRVHELEHRNAQLARNVVTQRRRAEMWRSRALKKTATTTAARSRSLDGTHAAGGRGGQV